ncbi:MAG: RICIN domain-containing protein [Flavisolibacter sp.]
MKKIFLFVIASISLLGFRNGKIRNAKPPFENNKVLIIFQENTGRLDVLPENTAPELKKLFAASVDKIAETFEDVKGELQGAVRYEKVIELTDVKCTRANLLKTLIQETVNGSEIDLFCFGHGSPNVLLLHDGETMNGTSIRSLLTDARAQKGSSFNFNLRLVYMCECYGSTVNDDWSAIGARASVGSKCVNFMAEPMITLFTHKYVLENKSVSIAAAESFNEAKATWTAANVVLPQLGYNIPPGTAERCAANDDKYETSRPLVQGDGNIKFNPLVTSFVVPTSFRMVGDVIGTTNDDQLAEGTYYIVNAASTSNKGLNVSSDCVNEPLCKVQLNDGQTSNNKWLVSKIDGILGGYTIKSVANNKFIDADLSLPGGNLFVANVFENGCKINTAARLSSLVPRTNQEWKIVNRGNGQFTIKCIMSGLYLDAANNCVNQNGCGVQLWENYTQATQKWKFVRVN